MESCGGNLSHLSRGAVCMVYCLPLYSASVITVNAKVFAVNAARQAATVAGSSGGVMLFQWLSMAYEIPQYS